MATLKPLPSASQPWVHGNGIPVEAFATFLRTAEVFLKMFNGNGGIVLKNAVDDAAAATAGVKVGALYRNGSIVMIRVA